MFSPENAYVVEQAQVITNTEDSNEAIVTSEMADNPPGSSFTARSPRTFSGTWVCPAPSSDKRVFITEETRVEEGDQVVGSTHSVRRAAH